MVGAILHCTETGRKVLRPIPGKTNAVVFEFTTVSDCGKKIFKSVGSGPDRLHTNDLRRTLDVVRHLKKPVNAPPIGRPLQFLAKILDLLVDLGSKDRKEFVINFHRR